MHPNRARKHKDNVSVLMYESKRTLQLPVCNASYRALLKVHDVAGESAGLI